MIKKLAHIVRSIALAAALGLSISSNNVHAQESLSGNIGVVRSEQSVYAEANAFYKPFSDVRGHTFMYLFDDNKGFFGKTTLSKEIGDVISLRSQAVHANDLVTKVGFGLEAKIPTPDGLVAKVNYVPFWKGSGAQDATTGYSIRAKLPKETYASGFGEVNLTHEKGVTWNYGELELGKNIGNTSFAYTMRLNSQGPGVATPRVDNGVAIRYRF